MRNFVLNEMMKLRRQTILKLSKLQIDGELKSNLPKLNQTMLPGPNPTYRTSIYHEREVLKQKIKIYLGMDYEKTRDLELFELAPDIDEIIETNKYSPKNNYLQIIKEACDACPSGKYYATDLCRNCVAHSCQSVCPKSAIIIEGGRAKIDKNLCVGCGLCEKACSYYAIVKLERPCEKACHVSAIKSDENSAAEIDTEKCIHCGACYVACPFGAIETVSALPEFINKLKNKAKINVIYAPSMISQFGPKVKMGQIKKALLDIGISNVYEAAQGADKIALEEAEMLETSKSMVTTSCCPSFVNYIKKHQKNFVNNISPSLSPMAQLAKDIKEEGTKTVFIGPCIAKKSEAYQLDYIDYVLTFEEIASLFVAFGIEPSQKENIDVEGSFDGWNFAKSGGVANAVANLCQKELSVEMMDGISEGKNLFNRKDIDSIDLIEGMACKGGCICGPSIMVNPLVAKNGLKKINV